MKKSENKWYRRVPISVVIFIVLFVVFCSFSGLLVLFDDPKDGMFRNIIPFFILFWPYIILQAFITIPKNIIITGFFFFVMPALINSAIFTFIINILRFIVYIFLHRD